MTTRDGGGTFVRLCGFAVIVGVVVGPVTAEVRLPGIISDNMVLQQGVRVAIWGWAEPGEKVTVSLAGQELSREANHRGKWRVSLRPMQAGGPFQMQVSGSNQIVIENVAIGEVWLGSGQSNMAMVVKRSQDFEAEQAAANYPMLRCFTVGRKHSHRPSKEVTGTWQVTTPEAVGGFTAAGYFFARELHKRLGVPVGIINSSWGGSAARAWTPRRDLAGDEDFAPYLEGLGDAFAAYPEENAVYQQEYAEWRKAYAKATEEKTKAPPRPRAPRAYPTGTATGLYNGMIAPIASYAIKGVIWYQGEADAGRWKLYQKLFPMMIQAWRRDLRNPDMPFIFVQLANYDTSWTWPYLREAQTMALALPNTGMAVAIDVGMAKNIHPTNKQAVGYRLALPALANVYGYGTVFSGPMYRGMEVADRAVKIAFDHVGGGLRTRDGDDLQGFTIAGADKQFVPGVAQIDGDAVVVRSDTVAEPVAVRYAWEPNPVCNLYNAEGLPMCPFRSDDWEPEE